MNQVHRDVASFEERRLHDVLIRRAQAPTNTLQMLPGDFQEIWDQRLLELLDRRRQYLQVCITRYTALMFIAECVRSFRSKLEMPL